MCHCTSPGPRQGPVAASSGQAMRVEFWNGPSWPAERHLDDAVRLASRGLDTRAWQIRAITGAKLASLTGNPGNAGPGGLTRREREIAELVTRGLTNRQIAHLLHIAGRTAENHVQHILTKLGFQNRSQIAAWTARQSHPHAPGLTPLSLPADRRERG